MNKADEDKLKQIKDECREFFNLPQDDDIPNPPITFLFTREEVDAVVNRKSEPWERAITKSDGLYFVHESVLQQITPHKTGDFWLVVKHEMTHWYFQHITGSRSGRPRWFNEGLAQQVAGQRTNLPKPTEEIVTEKYFAMSDQGCYGWGNLMVGKLLREYGKDKVLEVVNKIDSDLSLESFSGIFVSTLGTTLLDFEQAVKTDLNRKWVEKIKREAE